MGGAGSIGAETVGAGMIGTGTVDADSNHNRCRLKNKRRA
jgi:hypothetical protein